MEDEDTLALSYNDSLPCKDKTFLYMRCLTFCPYSYLYKIAFHLKKMKVTFSDKVYKKSM